MASAFGHAYTAFAIGSGYSEKIRNWKFLFLGILCSIIPDADVLSFKFGIPYDSFLGHRGFTHSVTFALFFGILICILFFREQVRTRKGSYYLIYFILCTLSHDLLDAMTTGGLGVAFFSPFSNTRYFLPWRPIKVSPIGAANFFSSWGIQVIKSEILWIGIPASIYIIIVKFIRHYLRSKRKAAK
jgi:inner membrane protein